MKKEQWDKFHKIIEQIESSDGYKIDLANSLLEASFKVMIINFSLLKQQCQNIQNYSHEQYTQKHDMMIEIMRLLINFLNSASAFVCHMRNHVGGIYKTTNPNFITDYQNMVNKEFAKDPLTKFIIGLRNFYDHYKILPIGIVMSVNNGRLISEAVLFKDELVKNDAQFKELDKVFIQNSKEHINILEICEDYLNKSLFPWLMQKQKELHGESFDKLKELKQQASDLYNDR